LSIDLETTEGRKEYLSDKLDDLLEGINQSYGTVLMEELLNRLELTVKDFNDEMKVLCDQLIKKEEERQQLLEMLRSTDNMQMPQNIANSDNTQDSNNPYLDFINTEIPEKIPESVDDINAKKKEVVQEAPQVLELDKDDSDIPEWEKKLAKLEKK
tara:strand:+ start:269 stop:736 length:468 start_codon:yes stop_codon:yes gene_type:complete